MSNQIPWDFEVQSCGQIKLTLIAYAKQRFTETPNPECLEPREHRELQVYSDSWVSKALIEGASEVSCLIKGKKNITALWLIEV